MFGFFKNKEKKIDSSYEKILFFIEEIDTEIKVQINLEENFLKHIFEENGESNFSSIICDYYAMAWFFINNPNLNDFDKLSQTQKMGNAITESMGIQTLGQNPFNFNREILVDGNKMQKVFSLEHEVVKKILNLQFNLDKPNEILTQFYKNLDHAIFCTSCGQKLESIYKYLFYLEKREEGLRELQLNFNVAGFTRYDEKEYDNQNQTTIMTDVDDVSIEKFLENLKLVLGPCVGKLSSKKIDINDKYVHGYLYGICDFTNQKYFLSNETDGLSTFMTLHSFVFEPNDPSMLGSIMGTSIKLSEEDDEEFNRGIMDGGSATAKLSKEGNPTFDIYQTLHDYIQENY